MTNRKSVAQEINKGTIAISAIIENMNKKGHEIVTKVGSHSRKDRGVKWEKQEGKDTVSHKTLHMFGTCDFFFL